MVVAFGEPLAHGPAGWPRWWCSVDQARRA